MDRIEIVLGKSIGNIELDMTKDEVHNLFKNYKIKKHKVFKEDEIVDLNIRVSYDEKFKVRGIEVTTFTADKVDVYLLGMNVFKTKAEDLIKRLEELSSNVKYFDDDKDLAQEYDFPDLKIGFWRNEAFHPKLFKDKEFLSLNDEEKEHLMFYWYFQSISIYK